MSDPTDFSVDAQVARINAEHGRRQTRFFTVFGVVSGLVVATISALVFVFDVVDESTGVWIILGVLVVLYGFMWTAVRRMIRSRRQAIRDAGGTAP